MEIIEWPCDLLRPINIGFHLRAVTRGAGTSITGRPQITAPGIQYWQIVMDLPRQFDGEKIRQMEALVARMEGRANIARLCLCDPYKYGARRSPAQQPWSDGTWFSDGTGFTDGTASHQLVVDRSCEAGGNTLRVSLTDPVVPPLRPGDMFSHEGRLYRVTESWGPGWTRFAPRARAPIPAGAALQTDPPQILARFASDDEGARMREMLRWGGAVTLTFEEAFA